MENLSNYYQSLYGNNYDVEYQNERYSSLIKRHKELFSNENIALFSTAGRTEIAGNHTDHNLGRVITASINLDTIAAVSTRDDNKVILNSEGFPIVEIDLSDLRVIDDEKNTTHAILRGIAAAFKKRGLFVGGWQANTTTNVLKGSGLSSSAAIEVLCATIFNSLYNDDKLEPLELAKIGQEAENVYFGKPSGLMDQIGCALGGIVGIDFKDAKNPEITKLDVDFNSFGYNLVIIDTKGNHADLTDEYAAIPTEMKAVAAFFNSDTLRDVMLLDFIDKLHELRKALNNDRAILRAYHYLLENARVVSMLDALKNKDISLFFEGVRESGDSSFKYLQNIYTSKNTKEQSVALALALAELSIGIGAIRVHGGGFGGTIQAYVSDEDLEDFTLDMEKEFGKSSVTVLSIRQRPSCRLI